MPTLGGIVAGVAEEFLAGASWGTGLAAVAVVVLIGAPRVKPLAKEAIKGYLRLAHEAQGSAAEVAEQAQDLYAEAKDEYETDRAGAVTAGPAAPPGGTSRVATSGAKEGTDGTTAEIAVEEELILGP